MTGESVGWEGRATKPVWPGPHGPRYSSNTWFSCCSVAVSRLSVLQPDRTTSPAGRGADRKEDIRKGLFPLFWAFVTPGYTRSNLYCRSFPAGANYISASLKSLQQLSSIFEKKKKILTLYRYIRLLHYMPLTSLIFFPLLLRRAWSTRSDGYRVSLVHSSLIFWRPFLLCQPHTYFLQAAFLIQNFSLQSLVLCKSCLDVVSFCFFLVAKVLCTLTGTFK